MKVLFFFFGFIVISITALLIDGHSLSSSVKTDKTESLTEFETQIEAPPTAAEIQPNIEVESQIEAPPIDF